MGLAMRGLTHCEKCMKPLKDDEYVLCKKCEEKKRKKQKLKRAIIAMTKNICQMLYFLL